MPKHFDHNMLWIAEWRSGLLGVRSLLTVETVALAPNSVLFFSDNANRAVGRAAGVRCVCLRTKVLPLDSERLIEREI